VEKYVSVIGGINIDIKGLPANRLLSDTSNPGSIYLSPGGVGRNIAHNLALLEVPVCFFSAIGEDVFGSRVLSKTKTAGVDVTYVQVLNNQHTGMYLSILNLSHELALAISDMEITHCVDKEYIDKHRQVIQRSAFVILETNLDLEVLGYILELCHQKNIPCLINPVSIEKSQKLHDIDGGFEYITTNRAELEAVCHQEIQDLDQLEDVCEQLCDRFEHILVTLGEEGVYYYSRKHRNGKRYPPFKSRIVDPNGAGDAFVAGLVCGVFRNFNMDYCIQLGMAAAHLTLQSENTVYEELSFERCSSLL
jgi:pseudouridine kinase